VGVSNDHPQQAWKWQKGFCLGFTQEIRTARSLRQAQGAAEKCDLHFIGGQPQGLPVYVKDSVGFTQEIRTAPLPSAGSGSCRINAICLCMGVLRTPAHPRTTLLNTLKSIPNLRRKSAPPMLNIK
jgi:hypothetical protein